MYRRDAAVKSLAVAAAFAIVSPALPARAAPPRATEQDYRALEQETKLDLSRDWAAYNKDDRSGSFGAYVDRRYRIRRDLGRGFVVAGAALFVAAAFFFSFGLSTTDWDRMNYGIGGTSVALGGALLIPGAVLWGVYGPKVERIDAANDKRDYGLAFTTRRGRLQLRPGGLGLCMSF